MTHQRDISEIIRLLGLQPHPEGGYFVETYRSDEAIALKALPGRYSGPRSFGTAIYYLLAADSLSAMHRIRSDETFHFYVGDPVEMLQLRPDGSGLVATLGSDVLNGQQPQVIVPRGVWQGLRLAEGGAYALLGTTVAPGFDFDDFELGRRDALVEAYPQWRKWIERLTRPLFLHSAQGQA